MRAAFTSSRFAKRFVGMSELGVHLGATHAPRFGQLGVQLV
jgi:hypothetical protein